MTNTDNETLRKVQLTQLEIAKEIKRVCEENDIKYFLTAGTLLGAVRHTGFIPWDDDMDIAMLIEDYKRFVQIAPTALNNQYELQNWYTDPYYALSFAKVLKKGTVFQEGKANRDKKSGIYVDIIVYSNAPKNIKQQKRLHRRMMALQRQLLMKCNYKPWDNNGKTNWKKRIGYFPVQVLALFKNRKTIISQFESRRNKHDITGLLYPTFESSRFKIMQRAWYSESITVKFEDDLFPIPLGYEQYLTTFYGDYMKPPPENERWNRHQIVEVSFTENN